MPRKLRPESDYLVYGLIDPISGYLRYIGKSTSGLARPRAHLTPHALGRRTRIANWLKSLRAAGCRPEIEIIETVARPEDLEEAECFWIAYFRSIGCDLTNLTDGGEGTVGRVMSPEARARISARRKGWRPSSETLEKYRLAGHSASNREKLRKMSDAIRGKKRSPEAVEKSAAKRRGRKLSREIRSRFSEGHGGGPVEDHLGNVYANLSDAAEKTGIDRSHICAVIQGRKAHAGGRFFWYVDRLPKWCES